MRRHSVIFSAIAMFLISSCSYVSSIYEVDVLYQKKDKERLAKFLDNNDPYTREKAVAALINLGECSDRVYAKATDRVPTVRATLVAGLAKCNEKRALDVYLSLANDDSPRVRKEVANAAIQNDHCRGDCLFALRNLLNDNDNFVKLSSAKALRNRFPDEAHFAVLDGLSSDLFLVKKEVLQILPLFKKQEDVKYLAEFLNSPDSQLRIAARVAIEKILGRQLYEDELSQIGKNRQAVTTEPAKEVQNTTAVSVIPAKKRIAVRGHDPALNDFGITGRGAVDEHAIAVIIGNKDYESVDIPAVNYAVRDAQIMQEVALRIIGAKSESVIYVENAKKKDFERIFGTLKNHKGLLSSWATPNSRIFVFYSGHGAPDTNEKKAYLVPVDSDVNFLKRNGYSLELLYRNLSLIKAESITVVLDACFSGITQAGALTKSASPVFVSVTNPLIDAGSNMSVMTSAKSDEISTWDDEHKYGLFTYHFVNSLKEAGRDGVITLGAIEGYIKKKVNYDAWRLMNREQNPQTFGAKESTFARIKRQ